MKSSVMFWLTYATTRNRSFATTVMGITIATNWLLKKKRVELLRPIPPVQLSPTTLPGQSRTRPVGWEALLHQHSASSAPPHTQHHSHVAEAVLLYPAVRGTAHSWKGYVQIGSKHLHAERNLGGGGACVHQKQTKNLPPFWGTQGTARGAFALHETIEMS